MATIPRPYRTRIIVIIHSVCIGVGDHLAGVTFQCGCASMCTHSKHKFDNNAIRPDSHLRVPVLYTLVIIALLKVKPNIAVQHPSRVTTETPKFMQQ